MGSHLRYFPHESTWNYFPIIFQNIGCCNYNRWNHIFINNGSLNSNSFYLEWSQFQALPVESHLHLKTYNVQVTMNCELFLDLEKLSIFNYSRGFVWVRTIHHIKLCMELMHTTGIYMYDSEPRTGLTMATRESKW